MILRLFRAATLAVFTATSAALLASLSLASGVYAMSVTPLYVELVSAGSQSRAAIKVTNTSALPLPVEAVIKRITLDEDGVQHEAEDGADDFLIVPAQAMIAPGATQVLRVQWVGEPLLAESRTYRFAIVQLPVSAPAENTQSLQVVFSFGVIINVAPPKGAPALEMTGARVIDEPSGKRRAAVIVRNPSSVHALFSEATVHLSSGAWRQSLSPSELRASLGLGLVQPGVSRRFTLPLDLPREVATIEARIDFAPPARR